jgi:cytochrome P450
MAGGEDDGRRPLVHDHVDVDLWDSATFAASMPDDAFVVLRRDAPVAWHPEKPRREGGHSGPGFWCITTHADIQTVSMQPELFSSWLGGFTGADIGGAVPDVPEQSQVPGCALHPGRREHPVMGGDR